MSDTYTFPSQLVQATVQTLEEMPARAVRSLLNAIEAECIQQDQARAERAEQEKIASAITAANDGTQK